MENTSQVHKAIDKAGYLGIALYILGFGLSELLHLPAMVFVVAGVLCWGHFKGWLLALIMAPLSCCLSFLVVRKIGGQVLADSQWSFVQKLMAKLDEYPVRTVVTLRLCFFLAPAINYVLALSSVPPSIHSSRLKPMINILSIGWSVCLLFYLFPIFYYKCFNPRPT